MLAFWNLLKLRESWGGASSFPKFCTNDLVPLSLICLQQTGLHYYTVHSGRILNLLHELGVLFKSRIFLKWLNSQTLFRSVIKIHKKWSKVKAITWELIKNDASYLTKNRKSKTITKSTAHCALQVKVSSQTKVFYADNFVDKCKTPRRYWFCISWPILQGSFFLVKKKRKKFFYRVQTLNAFPKIKLSKLCSLVPFFSRIDFSAEKVNKSELINLGLYSSKHIAKNRLFEAGKFLIFPSFEFMSIYKLRKGKVCQIRKVLDSISCCQLIKSASFWNIIKKDLKKA